MSTITLTAGDFGTEGVVTFGEENAYLPDRAHPGLTEAVLLADILEMETTGEDRSGQAMKALKLGARGLLTAGPVGIAAGLLAASQPKDVIFTALLKDGRAFTATTDARAYADFHTAQVAARAAALRDDGAHPADHIIARYVAAQAADPELDAPVADDPPPEPEVDATAPLSPERPAFGRRRRPA